MNISLKEISLVLGIAIMGMGCVNGNTLYFHESAKLGFSAEIKPDMSEPVSTHIGFKRRVAAVIPPKNPAENDGEIHKGEALSLLSVFDVYAHWAKGVVVQSNFASGKAAKKMAEGTNAGAIRSLLAIQNPRTVLED
jgi:hypothetical protein